jgi:hypothetical protein
VDNISILDVARLSLGITMMISPVIDELVVVNIVYSSS